MDNLETKHGRQKGDFVFSLLAMDTAGVNAIFGPIFSVAGKSYKFITRTDAL